MELNRHIPPHVQFLDGIQPEEPEVVSLDNGMPVYLIHTPGQDIVKVELLFEAGKWYEEKPLVANLTNKMLKEGTKTMRSGEIAEKIDFYGAHLETSADKDMGYVSLYSLNKHLGHTLPVLADVAFNPVFPVHELETLKQRRKQRFIVNNQKVRYVAKKRFSTLIYGPDHPYGRTVETEDFETIHRDDLVGFHSRNYLSGNCKIIAAGKIRPDFIDLLNSHLSGFNPIHDLHQNSITPSGLPDPGSSVKIRKSEAVQSAVRIGRVLFNKKHPDYAGMRILNTILGGYFGSRLMTNIREEKGYTYGIGSAVVSMQNSGYFFIASEVGADVTKDALREVYIEIDKLQQERVPQNELDLVKNYMLGSFLRSLDGAFALSENFKGLLEYGLNYDHFKEFVEVIKSINSEDIRQLACTYLDRSTLTELTVGN